jgi:hypothetical protein
MAVDGEDEENIPPLSGRRSQRVKGRKSASAARPGTRPRGGIGAYMAVDVENVGDDDVEGQERDMDDLNDDDNDDDEEEEVEKPRKRARKKPSTGGRRGTSGAKTNGVAKGTKGKGGRKPRESDVNVELEENTNECPMLGFFFV